MARSLASFVARLADAIKSRRREDAAALLVLAACVAKLTCGVSRVRDLPLDDEAAVYASAGIRMLADLRRGEWRPPAADWAPLHAMYYAALNVACPSRDRLFDVAWTVLVLAVVLSVYSAARAMSLSPLASLVAAGLLLATNFFHMLPFSSHLFVALLLGGIVVATRAESPVVRFAVLASSFACGAFLRPEMAPIGAIGVAACLLVSLRARGADALRVVAPAVPVAALAGLFGNPLGRDRAFVAFAQHYAFFASRRDRLADDPWMNFTRITARDFGDASTVSGALLRNPRAVAGHVVHNLVELPGNVLDLWSLRASVTSAPPPWLQGIGAVAIVAAVVALGRWLIRTRRTDLPPGERLVRAAFLGSCAAAAPGVLLVFPRAHYLVAPSVLGWLLAMADLGPLLERARRRAPRVAWIIACVGLLALVPAALRSEPSTLHQRRAVAAVRALDLAPAVVLDLTESAVLCAGHDAPSISPWTKNERWSVFVERTGVDVVFIRDRFLAHRNFADDPETRGFLADPSTLGFCEVYADPGHGRLLVKPRVLPPGAASRCPRPRDSATR